MHDTNAAMASCNARRKKKTDMATGFIASHTVKIEMALDNPSPPAQVAQYIR
jgi:hypothetical protein